MRAIDVRHKGVEKVICCCEVDGVLIDPGPAISSRHAAGRARRRAPRALLLTHIHFDHAGATGALVRRWPDLPVYVHERGAPHMVDPAKLVASAGRLYGGEEGLRELWGEMIPVPEANLRVLDGRRARRRGRVPRRVHARPRVPPRLLLPRAVGRGRSSATWAAPASRRTSSRSRRRRRRTSTSRRGSARSRRSAPGSRRRSRLTHFGEAPPEQLDALPGGAVRAARPRGRARRGRLRGGDGRADPRGRAATTPSR